MTTLEPPKPDDIRTAVKDAGLSRAQGAALLGVSLDTWHNWCAPVGSIKHRQMPPSAWELLLLKLDKHPTKRLTDR